MMNDFEKFAKDHGVNSIGLENYKKDNKSGLLLPQAAYVSPSIMEEREMHITQMDVFSRLMVDRIIFFGSEVTTEVCNIVTAQLLYLKSCSSEPIKMFINSPGGSVYDGYSVLDTMALCESGLGGEDKGIIIETVNTGLAASMGSMLLCCGSKGHRKALKHSRTMIHQPLGGAKGQATDILIEAEQIKMLREELYGILSERSGQPMEKVAADCERDHWLTSLETLEYGLIDEVIDCKFC